VTERLLQSEEAKLLALKNDLASSGEVPAGGTKVCVVHLWQFCVISSFQAKELEAQQNNYT